MSAYSRTLSIKGRIVWAECCICSSIDLTGNNDRLLIRADLPLKANGSVNRDGVYELRIENAKLAESFRGPRFGRYSPIYQLRVRQESANKVLILVQTAAGFQLGQLNQNENFQLIVNQDDVFLYRALTTPQETKILTLIKNQRILTGNKAM